MASYDPEFDHAPKFSPEYDDSRPRQRGCLFYGCVISGVLAVLVIVLLGIGAYLASRWFSGFIEEWTSPAPAELPRAELSEDAQKATKERVDAFRKALDEGTANEPLVLDSDDLNALIESNPDFRGKVFVRVEGDKLKGQVSIPLEKLQLGILKGRYLNGEAEFKALLSDGILIVTLDSLIVNGKTPPEQFLAEMRKQNLAKDAYSNPKHAEMLRRFESLKIRDGKVILTPRAHTEGPASDGPHPPAEKSAPASPAPTPPASVPAPPASVPAGAPGPSPAPPEKKKAG